MFTLFTTQTCSFCPTVKEYLAKFNREYETVDVTDDFQKRLELQQKYNAQSVPVLVGPNGEFMVGFNPAKLVSMLK